MEGKNGYGFTRRRRERREKRELPETAIPGCPPNSISIAIDAFTPPQFSAPSAPPREKKKLGMVEIQRITSMF